MGQATVYKYLRKSKKEWLNTRQLSEKLKVSVASCQRAVMRLYKNKEIKRKNLKLKYNHVNYVYQYK